MVKYKLIRLFENIWDEFCGSRSWGFRGATFEVSFRFAKLTSFGAKMRLNVVFF